MGSPLQHASSTPDVLRIYDAVRTAHLERFKAMAPAVVLYRRERYDFDPSVVPDTVILRECGRATTIRTLLRSRYRAVEVSEPLMTGRWLDLALQIVAIRLGDGLRRRHTIIGAYCIGLTDPVEKLRQRHRIPPPVGRAWAKLVIRSLVGSIDRLAFGTEAARDFLAGFASQEALARKGALFPALPAPCECAYDEPRDRTAVLFLGAFNQRKGVRQLLAAWDRLPDDHGLGLTLIGKGPFTEEVVAWAAARADVTARIDPPRPEVHAALRRAHVVVLPSQREGVWREQVGLPIVEALAHGCEVVTTDETGLANWLIANGHRVLDLPTDPAVLAGAIAAAAASARPAAEICEPLPTDDSRLEADAWLLRVAGDEGERETPALPSRMHAARDQAAQYYASARRSVRHYGIHPARLVARADARPVFVVGSPRSGTTFTAESIGRVPGFADLGELRPLKRSVAELAQLPRAEAARRIRRMIRIAQRIGLTAGRRAIEQTPESTFLIPAIFEAFPEARFVHLVRDGRDVAASLIQLGWLGGGADDPGADEVGNPLGDHARFWVEAQRAGGFATASEATRAAWVWRRYESTARAHLARTGAPSLEIRYERLVHDPGAVARELARFLDAEDRAARFVEVFGDTRASASGRWRRDLDADQRADVEREAGRLLTDLGYLD